MLVRTMKTWKTDLKSIILMAVWIFFLSSPECPKQPRIEYPFYRFLYPMICGTIFGSRPLLPHVLKRPQSDNPSPPRVCYLLNYFGAIAQFFQFRFRGYWQVAHKWRFMHHLSVSPVPKSGKTVHLPQSNSTPEVTNSKFIPCFHESWI